MSDEKDLCPDCRHQWRAHMGRNGGERCYYNRIDGPCPCRRKNPDIEAEDRLAAALWNMHMGRPTPEPTEGINTRPDPLADPEPIANETESGYARRRELVADARLASKDLS